VATVTGAANSGTAGYSLGGWTGSYAASDVIDKTAFSNDATAAITPTLSAAKRYVGACALSGTAAYTGGGLAGGSRLNVIDKTAFSNDATAAITATLSQINSGPAGLANSGEL